MIQLWIVLSVAIGSSVTNAVEVSTSSGTIRGTVLKSRLGDEFYAFRGIRYAKSPVGELRFKNPQPVEPWKPNVFDATTDGPQCPQQPFNSTDNSEDCLRLNVYSKSLKANTLKPVVVYIHPGAFYVFSALSKSFAGPEFLMDRDIVLVTINYRLGALGFLATGTSDAPGNAGLKDQVLALRWVKDHIRNFGGNPNSVTLLGYSAGSVSVGFHMMSPMSRGLFHRGIAMSASPIPLEKFPENQLDLAKKQAELVKCPTNNLDAMMKCLRTTPAEEFVKTFLDLYNLGYYMLQVLEKDHGQERFLIENPTEVYQEGRFQKTPLIIGMTKDEFVRIAKFMLEDKELTRKFNSEWEIQAPIILKYERNTQKSKYISTVLKSEYLKNQTLSSDIPFEPFGKLFSDAIIGFPVHRFAHLAARYVPVYYYRYSYRGRFSDFLYPGDTAYGSVHHDDLWYLLHNSFISPIYSKIDPEDKTVERLTRIVAQFATTGNPNNPKDDYLKNMNWKPLDLKKENFLEIGDELVMKERLFLERFDIWKRLFPLEWKGLQCNGQSIDYPEV
ncbi:venom carboxylesterase-6-like [Eupeodes corollae]|uniref:venom carboxylesterase-6-like n=1 Tax=Eupeodes corollae TaxID=290404 RepID=UPI002492A663|nr:venom carboxylesterase-6-like [Eupeodes corollae]